MVDVRLVPHAASDFAGKVDTLTVALLVLCGVVTAAIFVCMAVFVVRYRRDGERRVWPKRTGNLRLEVAWTAIPLLLFFGIYAWGADLYLEGSEVPHDAYVVLVVGKQWMWEFQHPNGTRELGELHVPAKKPIRLLMISQDVIHSFFLPEYRIKQDVLPRRYTEMWFEASKPGRSHLHCAEFCGMKHAEMGGDITVLTAAEHSAWLRQQLPALSPEAAGEAHFAKYGCHSCHHPESGHQAPNLNGLYGSKVHLSDGSIVVADESYLRESIVNPGSKIVGGYPAIMPSYEGRMDEKTLLEIVSYLRSLPTEGKNRAQ